MQALLLQQDHRALEIGEQMARIQNELASLTSVEMRKRDMKVGLLLQLESSCQPHFFLSILRVVSSTEAEYDSMTPLFVTLS